MLAARPLTRSVLQSRTIYQMASTSQIQHIQGVPDMKAVDHILVAATKVPGLIFCSGQTPIDGSGKLVPGGIKEHTLQCIKNLEKVLIHSGASLKNVVKVNIFLKNMDDFAAVNEVYEAALPTPKAGKLPNDVIVEIECIASV